MHIKCLIPLVSIASTLVAALPADNAAAGLRLIKTSEEDPGRWVTDEAKIAEYVAKDIHFIDITDITDSDVLMRLSTKPSDLVGTRRAVTYPSVVSHADEANGLIGDVNTDGPQAWLKTMTE